MERGRTVDRRQGRANIYFSVNTVAKVRKDEKGRDRKAERTDIKEIVALHVDVDPRVGESRAEARERIVNALKEYKPAPSIIVASGGGAQGFWFLDSPIVLDGTLEMAEDAKLWNVALERHFGGDNTHNIDRIMRVPGTINVPDHRKIKKGRVPALAELVGTFEFTKHPLSAFTKAEPVATAPEGHTGNWRMPNKLARTDVEWRDLPRLQSLDELDRYNVDHWAKLNVALGDENILGDPYTIPDNTGLKILAEAHRTIGHRELEGPYAGGRSDALWAAVCEFARREVPRDVALGIITDKRWGISASVLDKKDARRYALKQINDAYEEVASKAVVTRSVGNMPKWHETYDMSGAFPKGTYRNARAAIEHLGVDCRYDLFHDKITAGYEGDVPHDISPLIGEVTNAALIMLRQIIAERYNFDPKADNVWQAVQSLAYENQFDPICDYLTEAQGAWDRKPRLDTVAVDYFGAPDTPLNRAFMRLMLIAAVRRARSPGCKFDPICVLEGVEGTNKSGAIEALAGGPKNFSDATILGVPDKQAQENMLGVFLYEIADLSGIGRADVEKVKAFASRTHDRARKAYGRVREDVPRRCVIFASTNDREYLRSKTGNRRFWPVPTTVIDIDALRRDRDQIWGEAAMREAQGESIVLDKSLWDDARKEQDERTEHDPWEDVLAARAHECAKMYGTQQRVASAELLRRILNIDYGQQNSAHGRRLNDAMQRIGWKRNGSQLVKIDKRNQRGFFRDLSEDECRAAKAETPF